QQVVTLATRDAIPDMYANREFVAEGGLMSYGNNVADAYHEAGLYVGRILKGENPADLPVVQSTKFEFLLNLRTATLLGLDVQPSLADRAEEVIDYARMCASFCYICSRQLLAHRDMLRCGRLMDAFGLKRTFVRFPLGGIYGFTA